MNEITNKQFKKEVWSKIRISISIKLKDEVTNTMLPDLYYAWDTLENYTIYTIGPELERIVQDNPQKMP
jgi:hypothetical protein